MAKRKSSKNKSRAQLTPGKDSYSSAIANWFPGHMSKAINHIKMHLNSVDIVVEVRDARAPLASSNTFFTDTIQSKPRLIVFNKTDLADVEATKSWEAWFKKNKEKFIFINALDKRSVFRIVSTSKEIVRLANSTAEEILLTSKLKIMIIGLPNTGKSTIINTLSNRSASKVADRPGQTQKELWVQASDNLNILDTPGILAPTIDDKKQILQLSALNAISERVIDAQDTACYIVEYLLVHSPVEFQKHYKIDNLTRDLIETLNMIAKSRGCLMSKGEFDYERVYQVIINDFRKGSLGRVSLEKPPLL